MGPPSEVTGGIFQDLASFAIFFDLREATFEHFSPRIEARMYVGVLTSVYMIPFDLALVGIELRRYAKFQVHIFKTDSGKKARRGAGSCPMPHPAHNKFRSFIVYFSFHHLLVQVLSARKVGK